MCDVPADLESRSGAARAARSVRAPLLLFRVYKVLFSPLFTGSCRFLPTCSEYAALAVTRYGLLKGSWLAARRLSRCQPFGPSGLDPVPEVQPGPRHAERAVN